MNFEMKAMINITQELLVLNQQRATGELLVRQATQNRDKALSDWNLLFYMGRLVYASGGTHPVRRWYRALKHYCPDVVNSDWLNTAATTEVYWEVDLINQLVNNNLITTNQAKSVAHSIIQEVLFAIIDQRSLTIQWNENTRAAHYSVFISVDQVIQETLQLREAWREAGLGYLQEWMEQFSPDLVPILQRPPELASHLSPAAFQSMSRLLQGKLTLWDVALQMNRPLPEVMRVLLPFIRQGVIELKEIRDIPCPSQVPAVEAKPVMPQARGLIACIDDSPAIGRTMESILQPQGYEVLSILNPLQGISLLLERKPQLIFLDLMMPNTNGYELCTFLRKTTSFQNTPIVILTGNDGVVDRVRAKLTGASEFLGKPPEEQKVMQVVHKYLGHAPTSPMDTSTNLATV
jgi:chemotaxis family two-component system response regulator PixG